MKKNIFACLMLLAGITPMLNSCLEELENTDKIASSKFQPAIEFPLINSNFNMQEFLTEGNSKAKLTEKNGLMVITYTDSVASDPAESFFLIPNQQSPNLSINGSEIIFPSPGATVTITKNISFNFSPSHGEILDSIYLKAGQLALQVTSTLPANINLQYTISSLKISGSPLQQNINLNGAGAPSTSTNLQGAIFDLTSTGTTTNTISFSIRATITDTGQPINSTHNLSCGFQMNQLKFRGMFGDLRTHAFPFSADSIDVDIFDNAFNGNIKLESPTLYLTLSNSFGLPIGFNIQDITALKDANTIKLAGAAVSSPANPYRLSSPLSPIPGKSAATEIAFTPSNSNLPQLISSLPNYLSYWFGLTLNPAPASTKNFVFDDSRVTVGLHLELPFHGSLSGLTISKRFDFDGLGIDTK